MVASKEIGIPALDRSDDYSQVITALYRLGLPQSEMHFSIAIDTARTSRGVMDDGTLQLAVELFYYLVRYLDSDDIVDVFTFNGDGAETRASMSPLNLREYFQAQEFACSGATRYEPMIEMAIDNAQRNAPISTCPNVVLVLTDGAQEVEVSQELKGLLADTFLNPIYFIFVGHSSNPESFTLARLLDAYHEDHPSEPDNCHFVMWPRGHVTVSARLATEVFEPMVSWVRALQEEGVHL